MSVGTQPDTASISNTLTQLALQMRDLMQAIANLSTQVNGEGNGLQYLESVVGYSSAPNPGNPGDQSDAAWALQAIAYMNTVAGVAGGTVRQGGDGSAGSATLFNFNQALSPLWNGQ